MKRIAFVILFTFISCTFESIIGQVAYTLNTKEIIQKQSDTDTNYLIVEISGLQSTDEIGKPSLPVKYLRLAIPRGMKATHLDFHILKMENISLNKKILPAQYPIPTESDLQTKEFIEPDSSVYNSKNTYPENVVRIVHEGFYDGDIPIITVAVYPVQYHPLNDIVDLLTSIKIQLIYQETVNNRSISKKKPNQEPDAYINLLSSTIDNTEDINRFEIDKQIPAISNSGKLKSISADYEYIVLTTENLASSFNEFMAWKRRKGLKIGLVTVEDISDNYSGDGISGINDEAGKIRQFLSETYTNYGLKYVLLGGDNTIVPIRYGCGSNNKIHSNPANQDYEYYIPSDLYFADFNGDWKVDVDTLYGESNDDDPDYNSEIYVGRILCKSSDEVIRWTKKIKQYEIIPGNESTLYLTKSLMIQSDEMQEADEAGDVASHLSDFTHTIWGEIPSFNSPDIPTFPTGIDAIEEINNHYGLISWFSHAGPSSIGIGTKGLHEDCHNCKYNICALNSWDENDSQSYCAIEEDGNGLDNLNNEYFPGIVYTTGCSTTPFDNDFFCPEISFNLGQGWTTNTSAGGITYLGNTRLGWIGYSYLLYSKFAFLIDNNTTFHLGEIEALSKQNYNSSYSHYLRYSHDLVGCPETEIWTSSPNAFNNVSIIENGSSVAVSSGVEGSNICIMSVLDNGNTYFDYEPDVSSHTFNNVPFQYLITITKHDYLPFLKNPENLYVQNVSIYDTRYIYGENIHAGSNVTQEISTGPVVINNGSNVIFDTNNEVFLEAGFEVKLGGTFETK